MSGIGSKVVTSIGLVAFFIALYFIVVLTWAFVLLQMWGWFVVPTFNAPVLTIPVAIGLSMTVSMFTSKRSRSKGDEVYQDMAYAILAPLFTLAFGWFWSQFV